MSAYQDLITSLLTELIRKSGVREWEDQATRESMTAAAIAMADQVFGIDIPEDDLMPTKILVQEMDGTPKQLVFADHSGDFSPTAANDLRKTTDGSQETDVQMASASTASVAVGSATTTGACQSAKADLGENRADEYAIRMAVELAATPTAGNAIYLYWAPSQSNTSGNGNAGGVTGSSGAYTGLSNNNDASLKQLGNPVGIGIVTAQATGTVQVLECGRFRPTERYGSLVVRNAAGSAFHSDDAEIHVVFDPISPEFQN